MRRNSITYPYTTEINTGKTFLSNSEKNTVEKYELQNETNNDTKDRFLLKKRRTDNLIENKIQDSKKVKKYQIFARAARAAILEVVNI